MFEKTPHRDLDSWNNNPRTQGTPRLERRKSLSWQAEDATSFYQFWSSRKTLQIMENNFLFMKWSALVTPVYRPVWQSSGAFQMQFELHNRSEKEPLQPGQAGQSLVRLHTLQREGQWPWSPLRRNTCKESSTLRFVMRAPTLWTIFQTWMALARGQLQAGMLQYQCKNRTSNYEITSFCFLVFTFHFFSMFNVYLYIFCIHKKYLVFQIDVRLAYYGTIEIIFFC